MATGGGTADHLHCSVCLEHYKGRNPRLLSCHHSFCEGCLKKLVKYGQISCPKCREMTEVIDGDVRKLTMNFHILPFLEEIQKFEKICQLCYISVATLKCEECNQFLCQDCSESHSKIKRFKKHTVLKLCVKHAESISQLCTQCVKPVCFKCLILEHHEHEDLVVVYEEGMKELQKNMTIMRQNINKKLEKIHEIIEDDKRKVTNMEHLMNKYSSLQQEYLEKAEEARIKCEEIETCFNEKDKVMLEQKTAAENAEILANDLKIFEEQFDDHMTEHFAEIMKRAAAAINENPGNLKRMPSPEIITNIGQKYTLLTKPECVALINNKSLGMQLLVSGTTMWDQSIIVVDVEANFVRQIDRKGSILEEFQMEQDFEDLEDVKIHGNSLYIAQDKGIIQILDFNQDERHVIKHKIELGEIMKICVVCDTEILYSDYDQGKVYQFNPLESSTQVVLDRLHKPGYIHTFNNETGTKYIVSFGEDNLLQVYNRKWEPLYTIGKGTKGTGDGYLSTPHGSVCTGEGILVADAGNHRVCLFDFTGKFVKEYLTEADGLTYTKTLVYKSPFLWVICDDHVLCFKVHGK